MTAITRSPENTNLLQPTKFLLTFDRIRATQYFCQSVNLPGVSLGEVNRAQMVLKNVTVVKNYKTTNIFQMQH